MSHLCDPYVDGLHCLHWQAWAALGALTLTLALLNIALQVWASKFWKPSKKEAKGESK